MILTGRNYRKNHVLFLYCYICKIVAGMNVMVQHKGYQGKYTNPAGYTNQCARVIVTHVHEK